MAQAGGGGVYVDNHYKILLAAMRAWGGGLPCVPSRPPAFSALVHPTASGLNFYLNHGLLPFVRLTPSSPKAAALTCPAPMWTKSRAGRPSSSDFPWDFDFACSRYWVSGAPCGVLPGPPSPLHPQLPGSPAPLLRVSRRPLCSEYPTWGRRGWFLSHFLSGSMPNLRRGRKV